VNENAAYIIAWKVRGGFRKHPDDSPGAILTPFKGVEAGIVQSLNGLV